jgi:hypothetical protein
VPIAEQAIHQIGPHKSSSTSYQNGSRHRQVPPFTNATSLSARSFSENVYPAVDL